MQYRLSVRDLAATAPEGRETEVFVSGFLADIKPPVTLNPEIVARHLTNKQLAGMALGNSIGPLSAAALIGSTDERTVIYGGFSALRVATVEDVALAREYFANRIADLLTMLGASSVQVEPYGAACTPAERPQA